MENKLLQAASKLHLKEEDLSFYGKDKAKIIKKIDSLKKGKLILVTSINPTPLGEGKTTITIGINDILNRYGKSSVAVLREPSLGPVFGRKGGATGGGKASLMNPDDINLHFTGDFHAITSANNLLCAALDNHIFQGNELDIDENNIVIHRCMDMNDRELRNITLRSGRKEKFEITTATEMMAIFCLSKNLEDLKNRLGKIIIAYDKKGKRIYAKDLKIENALLRLLQDAFDPNLVMSEEGNPVIVHGGPFANIAHGCNSIKATSLALSLADYVITEAGFGSDLGGLKFLDIKCRMNDLKPSLILINATIRSLKYQANTLEEGISNLQYHIENMKSFYPNIAVVLNKFESDAEEEIDFIKDYCEKMNVPFMVCDSYLYGSENKEEIVNTIDSLCKEGEINFPYELTDSLEDKIDKLCKKQLKAKEVVYDDVALQKIKEIHDPYPICVAKTQYSITDDPEKLGYPKDHTMKVTDIRVQNGAEIITVYMGNILTMPGLNKTPNYLNF